MQAQTNREKFNVTPHNFNWPVKIVNSPPAANRIFFCFFLSDIVWTVKWESVLAATGDVTELRALIDFINCRTFWFHHCLLSERTKWKNRKVKWRTRKAFSMDVYIRIFRTSGADRRFHMLSLARISDWHGSICVINLWLVVVSRHMCGCMRAKYVWHNNEII